MTLAFYILDHHRKWTIIAVRETSSLAGTVYDVARVCTSPTTSGIRTSWDLRLSHHTSVAIACQV